MMDRLSLSVSCLCLLQAFVPACVSHAKPKLEDPALIEKRVQDYVREHPRDLRGILDRCRHASREFEELASQGAEESSRLARAKLTEMRLQEDEYAVQYFNEAVDSAPWVDLLSAENFSKWFAAGPVRISPEGGGMIVSSTVPRGVRERGLVCSGKRDFWIDFYLEFEVEIRHGGFSIVGRYSGPSNFFQLPFETGGQGNPIVEGAAYKCYVSSAGNELTQHVEKWNPQGKEWEILYLETDKYQMPRAARSGAFGFGIMPGGEAVFRKIRARVVRTE